MSYYGDDEMSWLTMIFMYLVMFLFVVGLFLILVRPWAWPIPWIKW